MRFRTCLVLTVLCAGAPVVAQTDRIAGQIDSRQMVALKGNVNPKARPEFDQGPLDPSKKLTLVTLMLKASGSQQADLDQLLTSQQDPLSPGYHKWLTPEQYAARFGLSPADISKIVAWLRAEGFSVDDIARGRNWIACSATVAQVQSAFRTEIHKYMVDGEMHFANSTEPSVPATLAPLLIGIRGLNDFHPKAPTRPRFTDNSGNNFLAPDDLATIYDVVPLYQAGIDGTGQNLVVAGQTKVNLVDITTFRSTFSLAGNPPTEMLVTGSVDPGITADMEEADLDLEWSGAVARGANIIFVYSTDVFTSVMYAISQNLAPVISFSYSHCELALSGTDAESDQAVAQQANAQGITWIVSTGDSGAANCDRQGQSPLAQYGLSTNIFASIPEVTGVGGTEFNEAGGTYWGANSATNESALGYIPEIAWNDSGANGLAASGGGYSIFYPQPSWQTGPGVTATNARSSPDVALSASTHDGYIIVTNGEATPIGGTSAAAPSFAGMIALLNQYQVSKGFQASPGQGNLNPNLYRLAQSTANVFHDIVSGNNIVPCQSGSPDCSSGSYGYNAGPGYDPVTGLGSVDAANLITEWNNQVVNTTTVVTANPSSFTSNGSTQVTATVSAVGSSGVPTGTVAFNLGNVAIGSATLTSSGAAASATITVYGGQLTAGNDTIRASYSGSTTFSPSSGSVTLAVSLPAGNSAVVPTATPNPVFEELPDSDGFSWFYTINLTETAGTATTLTGFTIDGVSYSTDIADFFGSASIPALGTISASIRSKDITVPANLVFGFTGVDAGGHAWSQQLTVPFYGDQITASMAMTSFPGTVRQQPDQPENCQWPQYLGVEERNGHSVTLTKFLTGSPYGTLDLTSQILVFFPSTTLPALGTLVGAICWSGFNPVPQTKTYEIDGVDDTGTTIVTTGSAVFDVPATGGALSTSETSLALTVPGSEQATSTTLDVTVSAGEQWTVSIFPDNRKTRWLTVYPLSGGGPATVTVVADSTGLAAGVYSDVSLVIQSNNTTPQFIPVPVTFTVGNAQAAPPAIGAVVNGASFSGGAVVPGEIATIFGTNLTTSSGINFTSGLPLPTEFLNVSVTVDGSPVPLFAVDNVNGQQQINFQVPFGIAGAAHANIAVTNNGVTSAAVSVVVAAQPGIFNYNSGGQIFGSILHSNFQLADTNHPASPRETVLIYCTGLGPVDSPPASGAPAKGQHTTATPTVSIGGLPAAVSFSGLAPGFVGLYQINAAVPAGLQAGNQPVVINIDGASSNSVLLPVN
jgi:uncharacterized protein (TIGR03437 family)